MAIGITNAIVEPKAEAHIADRGNPHDTTKAQVGLGNVDNTSDANKPVSTATQTALNLKMNNSVKGVANGVASLGADGKVPSTQLPSYVDDVLEFATKANFPASGETGKIYVSMNDNKTWRWSGSAYVEISASLALGETSSTAYRGDRGKQAYENIEKTVMKTVSITMKNKTFTHIGSTPAIEGFPVSYQTGSIEGYLANLGVPLANITEDKLTPIVGFGISDVISGNFSTVATIRNYSNNFSVCIYAKNPVENLTADITVIYSGSSV